MKTPMKSLRLIPWPVAERLNLIGFAVWHGKPVEVRHVTLPDTFTVGAGVLTGPGRLSIVLGPVELFFLRTN